MRHDRLADCLSTIKNGEKVGKRKCEILVSKLIIGVLSVMKNEGYIGDFEKIEERNDKYQINLLGKINNCNVIKPRFSVKSDEFEKWEERFLPARRFGILIVSTSQGIMSHKKAEEKNIGGKLLGYVY